MICVKIIPKSVTRCLEIGKESVTLNELLNMLRDYLESEDIVVVVNGRIAENLNVVVTEKDEIVLVEAFLGG
ncbi:MAG: MoaD/ThiS family protein [Desulfurococcaceae archaeon]